MARVRLDFGAEVDFLNKDELHDSLTAQSNADWLERARGIKRLRFKITPGVALSTTAGYVYNVTPNQGYSWSLRSIAVALSAAQTVQFYLGTDTSAGLTSTTGLTPLAGAASTVLASATWGSGQAWIESGEFPVIWAGGAATLQAVSVVVVETPTELIWKLI